MASAVRDLELDLDAFEGPFDLLLTLLLKDAIQPSEIDMAGIVVAFVERLAERDELDLDACGEFLVLIAALLELKARHLFPDEEAELAELEPEEAAEELARRLAEYRRMKHASVWLRERLDEERERYFRLGPAPLAPEPERRLAQQEPLRLVEAMRALAVEPPHVSLSHLALRFPPVAQFVERFRAVLLRRRRFDFDAEVHGLSRVEQAVAFLALLELRKEGEIAISQAVAVRADQDFPHRSTTKGCCSGPPAPPDLLEPGRRARPHGRGAARRRLAAAHARRARRGDRRRRRADRDRARAPARALQRGPQRHRPADTSPAATRSAPPARRPRPARACSSGRSSEGLSQAALETVAIVAYLGPVSRPEIARIRGVAADSAVASLVERGLIAEAGRESGPGGAVRYRVTTLFERVFGLESLAALPRLDDIGEDQAAIRERLLEVAEARAS